MISDSEQYFREQYLTYARRFISWARKRYPSCPGEEIEDACQEAYMVVYQHWIEGKVAKNFQAFLFAVGKNILRDKLKRVIRAPIQMEFKQEEEHLLEEIDEGTAEQYNQDHQASVVESLLAQIGSPCNEVLRMSFFADYAVESIASAMGYESERVASARKSKCLRQLRNLLQKLGINKDDLL
ncbi:MAG: sigma-70 family RNA polymerase sigma factor [Bacteroidota bacterium]